MKKHTIVGGIFLTALAASFVAYYSTKDKPASEPTQEAVATPANAYHTQAYLGFLTTDGSGVASHPFQIEHDYDVEWEIKPSWTALPVYVSGDVEDNIIHNAKAYEYKYEEGTEATADAYYTIIEDGYQEKFEDLFCEIYDKLNGIQEFSEIDGTALQDFIHLVGNNEVYGTLRDHLTDALVVVKDYNESGPSEELNDLAFSAYNGVYSWLFSFSTEHLGKN